MNVVSNSILAYILTYNSPGFFEKTRVKLARVLGSLVSSLPQFGKTQNESLGCFVQDGGHVEREKICFSRLSHRVRAIMSLFSDPEQLHKMDSTNRAGFVFNEDDIFHRNGLIFELIERIQSKVCSAHIPLENEN